MCTLVIRRDPAARWPVLIAANRDEMRSRPWQAPGRHWPELPDITAGRDLVAGGSWLGLNDSGVVAGILNRPGALGPAPGKRSRGELVLDALGFGDAVEAATALKDLNTDAFRPFNMLIADNRDAYWLRHDGEAPAIAVHPVPEGVAMLTAHDLNDTANSGRIRTFLPKFEAAPPPDPDREDYAAWTRLLGAGPAEAGDEPSHAMSFGLATGFGTVSSSILALPGIDATDARPVWLFADGPPDRTAFQPLEIAL